MREEKTTWWLAAKRCDVHNRACPDIAHYNFSTTLQSCGLSRGAYGSALRTRKDAALDPARTFSPVQPDQRVTRSLETPLEASPQDPKPTYSNQNYGKDIGQHTPVQHRAERGT